MKYHNEPITDTLRKITALHPVQKWDDEAKIKKTLGSFARDRRYGRFRQEIRELETHLRNRKCDCEQAIKAMQRNWLKNHDRWMFSPENIAFVPIDWLASSYSNQSPRPAQSCLTVAAGRHASLLTLFGPSAVGKTTAALRAIALRGITAPIEDALIVTGMEISVMDSKERKNLVVTAQNTKRTLLLDDLDKGSKSESVSAAILQIISSREKDSDALTLITTNQGGKGLLGKFHKDYAPPIVNRLKRNICVDFTKLEYALNYESMLVVDRLRELFPFLKGNEMTFRGIPI